DGFDVRDAASRGVRRKASNQPGGKRSRGRAKGGNEQEAQNLPAVSPSDERVAKTVRLLEEEAEDRSDKSRKRAGDERERRKRQETAVVLALVVRHWLPLLPLRPRIAIFAVAALTRQAGDVRKLMTIWQVDGSTALIAMQAVRDPGRPTPETVCCW